MAKILSDRDLQKLLGKAIIGADPSCLRPNSYILRLGSKGEFINTEKTFEIGESGRKRGIKLQPGHAIGITSLEIIDFRRATVEKIHPGCDLHGILSPTTDLSREGIMAATTQIDAGYHGTLNWTITNSSNKEARFLFGEKIYRLTIFLLEEGEKPDALYAGEYQGKEGYIPSRRKGAPQGMREAEWEHAFKKDGPEEKIDEIINSGGYPWNIIGSKLKEIGQKFETVSNEYAKIHESIKELNAKVAGTPDATRKIFRDESVNLQNRLILSVGSVAFVVLGLVLQFISGEKYWGFIKANGTVIGLVIILIGIGLFYWVNKRK